MLVKIIKKRDSGPFTVSPTAKTTTGVFRSRDIREILAYRAAYLEKPAKKPRRT